MGPNKIRPDGDTDGMHSTNNLLVGAIVIDFGEVLGEDPHQRKKFHLSEKRKDRYETTSPEQRRNDDGALEFCSLASNQNVKGSKTTDESTSHSRQSADMHELISA